MSWSYVVLCGPQTVATKLEGHNYIECLYILYYIRHDNVPMYKEELLRLSWSVLDKAP